MTTSKSSPDPVNSLYRLSELTQFEVAKNDSDVRGWTLIDLNGERLGKIHELIVDTHAEKVRYLDVEVDPDVAHLDGKHHILVPIRTVRLHRSDDNVLVENLDRSSLRNYPVYDGGSITPEYEYTLHQALNLTPEPHRLSTNADADNARSFPAGKSANPPNAVNPTEPVRTPDKTVSAVHATTEHLPSQKSFNLEEYLQRDKQSLIDELRLVMAQRDIATAERDIARAERDMVRRERDNLRKAESSPEATTDHLR